MALKGDRQVVQTASLYSMDLAAERGVIVIADYVDESKVVLPGGTVNTSNRPIGMLLDDVEDLDFTAQAQLLHRNVVPLGSAVSVALQGEFRTDMIPSGISPLNGEPAYLAANGNISNAQQPSGSGVLVGRWLSEKDADGFARIALDTIA